jgi:hypothetical protein
MTIWVFEGLNNDRPDIKYFLEKYMEITPDVLFWDKTPTWYCADHWVSEVEAAIAAHGKPDLMLGASMGGFGALLFQPIIQAKKCIIFGPQADSRSEILKDLPGDNIFWANRLEAYTGTVIPEYKYGDIDIYYGNNKCDTYHRNLCKDLGYNIIDLDNCHIHCSFTHLFEEQKLSNIIREKIC